MRELLPPEDPAAFERLCLDLWREIWGDSSAQLNGRSGFPQAGVDVFGRHEGRTVGVQCKQKDGLLRTELTVGELEKEVKAAHGFRPPLSKFILATSGPRHPTVQERARELTESEPFKVEVWSWDDMWHEIEQRPDLFKRTYPIYWPAQAGVESRRIAPSKLPPAPAKLFGRADELAALDAAWSDPATHVLTVVAWGGVGKTSLVGTWTAQLAARDFDGADYFSWSFYSQGTRDQGSASADPFIDAALRFFGDWDSTESARSPWDKGAHLAELVAQRRTLLVLDGLEPLQHPPGPLRGELKDDAMRSLLYGLAARNQGLCVVTTRESVEDLAGFRAGTAPEWKLEHLSTEAGVALWEKLGVNGSQDELEGLAVRGETRFPALPRSPERRAANRRDVDL